MVYSIHHLWKEIKRKLINVGKWQLWERIKCVRNLENNIKWQLYIFHFTEKLNKWKITWIFSVQAFKCLVSAVAGELFDLNTHCRMMFLPLDEKFDIEWDSILPIRPLKDTMYVQITFFQGRL